MSEQFPTYEQQIEKLRKTFNSDEMMVIRVDEGIFEVRVLFDGYDEDQPLEGC